MSRAASNRTYTSPAGREAYAGALLKTNEGALIGTLCVLDRRPREFTPEHVQALRVLARQVMSQLELRRAVRERAAAEARSRQILDSATDYAILSTDPDSVITSWSEGASAIFRFTEADVVGKSVSLIFTPKDAAAGAPNQKMARALEHERP